MQVITKLFRNMIDFVSAAVSRIFGLTDDEYPSTGVQPYSGDPSHEH
jgi:hypothetical protein